MIEHIKLIIKGFFIGIANIIPGVSGGTLMIAMGIYEDLIDAISHFFKNFKKNIKLLALLGVGTAVALISGSFFITGALDNFRLPTILFFIGLILGGIPMLYNKIKGNKKTFGNISLFVLTFVIILALAITEFLSTDLASINFTNMNILSYIVLFFVGIIAAASMVVPGISGSFILILLGYYEPVLNTIKDLLSMNNIPLNLSVLFVFGIGVLFGIILVAKLIEFLLNKFEIKTYYAILGFVFSSIISILLTSIKEGMSFEILHIILAIPLFIAGFFIAFKLSDKE